MRQHFRIRKAVRVESRRWRHTGLCALEKQRLRRLVRKCAFIGICRRRFPERQGTFSLIWRVLLRGVVRLLVAPRVRDVQLRMPARRHFAVRLVFDVRLRCFN